MRHGSYSSNDTTTDTGKSGNQSGCDVTKSDFAEDATVDAASAAYRKPVNNMIMATANAPKKKNALTPSAVL